MAAGGSGQWRSWATAMREALYGDEGFYLRERVPRRHFRTSAHVSPHWAAAIAALADRTDRELGAPQDFSVVDLGAGGGELVAALADVAPDRWQLLGVDLAPRPAMLPDRVSWSAELPERVTGLLVAVEWLDVVPVDVVELGPDGPRLVEVDRTGRERLGAPPPATGRRWLEQWWPLAEVGDRAEIGRPRDAAWAVAVRRLERGVSVAVDYGAVPGRDVAGTLTGYRDGRQVPPVPDGSMDLTAHVLLESCAEAAAVGAGGTLLVDQREALRALGLSAQRPPYDGDPVAYLERLSAAGAVSELLDPSGLGGFRWLMQARGCALPLDIPTGTDAPAGLRGSP